MSRAEIVVDLAAIRHNVTLIREHVRTPVMTIVKADAYGHGMVEVAHAAKRAGAEWLGAATPDEAVTLRRSGLGGPILCWLSNEHDDFDDAVGHDIDLSSYSIAETEAIGDAGRRVDLLPRVQLKIDTGLSRGGVPRQLWAETCAHAAAGERDGRWRITGIWSHLASSDDPTDPANSVQEERFTAAVDQARAAGLEPEVTHLANSAAALLRPSSRFNLVRVGIATYGLDPAPDHSAEVLGEDWPLVPAMTVRAELVMAKGIAAGDAVSYNHTWTAEKPTVLGLVPIGYGEGISRRAGNTAEVLVNGARAPIRGRICMDQFMVETSRGASAGDEVLIFGPGTHGEPTAQDWARATGTISYEIVTQIGGRMDRVYVDSTGGARWA